MINDQWMVTAAHCVPGKDGQVTFYFGANDYNQATKVLTSPQENIFPAQGNNGTKISLSLETVNFFSDDTPMQ